MCIHLYSLLNRHPRSSLVCMPVCNYDGEVIGVAQIMNKRDGGDDEGGDEFTETDLKVRSVTDNNIFSVVLLLFCVSIAVKLRLSLFIVHSPGFRALPDILRHRHPERAALRSLHPRIQEEQGQSGRTDGLRERGPLLFDPLFSL